MTVIRVILAIMMVTILPAAVGSMFLPLKKEGAGLLHAWIYGQVVLWAGFLFVCVPMILLDLQFPQVEGAYLGLCGLLLLMAGACRLLRRKKQGTQSGAGNDGPGKGGVGVRPAFHWLWLLFAALFLVQIFCVFFLAYEDGDDSYYVAITTYSKEVKTLYRNIPYTGAYTGLDLRHSLAPFPVWVAVLADVAGLSGATTAHVMMPILVLCMTYGLFGLLGEKLLGEGRESWKMPLFLSFCALLVLFGGYSIYSAENFLLVRAGQGKAVLANVVIPALLYLTVLLLERLEKKEAVPVRLWVLLCATMTTGCLCSTLGTFLLCVFLGVAVLCAIVAYRRWRLIFGTAAALVMPALMAALYVLLG